MKRTSPPLPPPGRRRLFAAITLIFPFVLLACLEIGLRLFGYGPDLSLFTTEILAGRSATVMNPAVKNRYFARVPFNPSTSPDYFTTPKPAGTFRIFCLGGSTTVGYPYWYNGAFSTFLRDRLHAVFPERGIEVINMGMTATNSYTVNDMARDILDEGEPDLIVVYDGHNEFYGALGVASNESVGGSPWLTRLYLRAIHFRTVLLLRDAIVGALSLVQSGAPQERGATMMERLATGQEIPYGSPLYVRGLEVYRTNVADLISLCRDRGIPVMFGSQVSNLRDLPPFVSRHRDGLPEHLAAEFARLMQDGDAAMARGNADSAAAAYAGAVRIDTLHAGAQYRLGRALDTLGNTHAAHTAYARARDLDCLRFRMSTDFNNALRELCRAGGAVFVDMEETFRISSRDSLIGNELLIEHLHPNARGFFLMGREFARSMAEQGLPASPEEWARRDTTPEETLWAARPLTVLDERMARRRTEILLSGWPFRSGVPIVDPVAEDDTLGQIVERVTRGEWNWLQAHTAAAEYFLARGERAAAAASYRTIINQLPLLDARPHLALARLYLDERRLPEARERLAASLDVTPTILAYRALADLSYNEGLFAEAVGYYRKTFSFPQSRREQVENGYLLALAAARGGDTLVARQEVLKVLALQPDFQPGAALLSGLGALKRE